MCAKILRVLLSILSLSILICARDIPKNLSPHYRDWLTKDVVYIITNEERAAFLELPSDEARENFIERFWEVRNPTPGAPENTYRSEHYRRLEYANTYFGHASHTEGWRTDMGRIYITLGEPSQRQKLLGLQKITPMEIWFYSNANPALPPFFYVVFYQRDNLDEFRLYSPYSDGPERLITAQVGPTRADALKIISQDAGKDVARVTLSLLTDEPVDFQNGTISLQSDVMLATIKNLANNPLSREEISNRRRLMEDVTHRLVLGGEYLDVATVPLRDAVGNSNLNYVLRLKKPEDFTVHESEKGGYYYSVLVSAKVSGADGKALFTDEKKVSGSLSQSQLEQVKSKVFGYEGWLPLPPGKYKIQFQLTNLLASTAFRREVEIVVPDPQAVGIQVSNLLPFADASRLAAQDIGHTPFSGAGVKFMPMTGQELQLVQGQPLKFFYQVWTPPASLASRTDKKLEVDYVYGRMGAQANKSLHDEIPLEQVDAGGSVINGKQIPTGELEPGNYRLAMTLRDPVSGAKAFGALSFGVYTSAMAPQAWDISDDGGNIKTGVIDYQRAACYLAQGDKPHATEWLQNAFSKNSNDERFRDKLISLDFEQQNYSKVVELFAKGGLNESTDDRTIVLIAESFDKTGNLGKAVAVMESATQLRPGSGTLLLGLADYYRRAGEIQKATQTEQKGRALLAASHSET